MLTSRTRSTSATPMKSTDEDPPTKTKSLITSFFSKGASNGLPPANDSKKSQKENAKGSNFLKNGNELIEVDFKAKSAMPMPRKKD